MKVIREILELLTPVERRQAIWLLPLVIVMALAEVAGIASIAPFLALLADPDAIHNNRLLAWVHRFFGFEGDRQFLLAVGAGALLIIFLSNGVLAGGTWALAHFGAMRNHSISKRLLVSYLKQPYTFFLEHNSAGLAHNILQEVVQVINGVVIPGLQAIAKGVAAVAVLIMLVVLEPLLALLAGTLLLGAYALIYGASRKFLSHIGRERVRAGHERHKAATEAMGGIKQLKLVGRESEMVERFEQPSYRFAQYETFSRVISTVPRYLLEGVAFASVVAIVLVFLSLGQTVAEMIPVLGVYAFAGYRLLPAMQQIFQSLTQVRYSQGALDTVHGMVTQVDAGAHLAGFPSRKQVERLGFEHSMVLDSVSYQYPGSRRPTLSRISLEIPARSSVAFVGETGAGKTTLVDLILGLLSPTEGAIRVDGVKIDRSNVARWQKHVGYVPQSIFLQDDTITGNIALGIPDNEIDSEAVRRAARLAQLGHFIENELPDGYETMVGERGVRLSGGQQQRLGIARALYDDPDVLVLDEATSALDSTTEHSVFEAISDLSGSKTLIMIAHRLSTVQASDLICVLDHGNIVSVGNYEELIERSPYFKRIALAPIVGKKSTSAAESRHRP